MSNAKRTAQTPAELTEHLREQIQFLQSSAKLYDDGATSEAKRLASTIRLLVHATRNSHSLLGQVGKTAILFFDTSRDLSSDNLLAELGLVEIAVSSSRDPKFVARLDSHPYPYAIGLIPFDTWWRKPVIRVPGKFELTRANIVLTMANQDGGAHVDSAVDAAYYELTRENAIGFTVQTPNGTFALREIERASVRQIAQEVLKSIALNWTEIPSNLPETAPPPDNMRVVFDAQTGATTTEYIRPREVCSCKSGKPYRECHGKKTA
jgi:hypothetical protein